MWLPTRLSIRTSVHLKMAVGPRLCGRHCRRFKLFTKQSEISYWVRKDFGKSQILDLWILWTAVTLISQGSAASDCVLTGSAIIPRLKGSINLIHRRSRILPTAFRNTLSFLKHTYNIHLLHMHLITCPLT